MCVCVCVHVCLYRCYDSSATGGRIEYLALSLSVRLVDNIILQFLSYFDEVKSVVFRSPDLNHVLTVMRNLTLIKLIEKIGGNAQTHLKCITYFDPATINQFRG